MVHVIDYAGPQPDTDFGPSKAIWSDCDILNFIRDPSKGFYFFDDFLNFEPNSTDAKYDVYIDTGVTVTPKQGVLDGVVEIGGNDADNDEGVLSAYAPMAQISDGAGEAFPLWFEARWKKASIADNALASFIGLAYDDDSSVTVAKTLCLTDNDGALGAFSFIGFHVDQADGDALDFVYKAEGQTAVVKIAGVQTLVADTWYKLGFKYDPNADADRRIKIYVDGEEQSTYVTATNIAAATFPDAEKLAPVWAAKVGTDMSAVLSQLDWWRLAQARC